MPKMKSHRGAKKRLHYSAGGKLMHQKAGRRHNMIGKGGSWRRRMKRAGQLAPGDQARSRSLLPYDH